MKKKVLFIILILIAIINTIINNKKEDINNLLTIKTYINGKLVAKPPLSSDGYIVESITCDDEVATKEFNYSTWRLEITNITKKTICEVKFKNNTNETFATYLKNKMCSSTPTTDNAAKDCLVNENGYRYEGENPNNYVIFNNELWRILGVFDNMSVADSSNTVTSTNASLVKLIRDNTLDALGWGSGNDWTTATLQQYLNEGYLNKGNTLCIVFGNKVSKTCNFNETGINNTARNMIENIVWNIGAASGTGTVTSMYEAERGSVTAGGSSNTVWIGKIGLIYPSDYGYAVLNKNCSRSISLSDFYSNSSCAGKNWLHKDGSQWTLTSISSDSNQVFYFNFSVSAAGNDGTLDPKGVRPSLYLKSSVKYVSGTGTYSDPYIIS